MTDHVHDQPTARRSRLAAVAVGIAALALTASACAPGVSTSPSTQGGQLSSRTITVSSGAYSATGSAAIPNGLGPLDEGFALDYNSSSAVIGVNGTLAYNGGASLTLHLTAGVFGLTGSATLVDPGASVSAYVTGTASSFSADDHGNVSGSISDGATTISFATASPAAAVGSAPALEALLAAEDDYCAEAQQTIAGLNPAQVPVSSIVNTRETPRATFAGSKSVVSPLTVRTWTDTVDVASSTGDLVTISKHISCKMRSGDHIATTGVTTSPTDASCAALNQKSFDLALAQLSPGDQALAVVPSLGADVVRQTGVDWTTPLPSGVEFDGTNLRAHALQVNWTDPDYAIFPDTIRGVHYCTVWAPAYAYEYLVSTL